ncbi:MULTISPECIES: LysR family transcriptional regulator [Streptomyces]|uniref:LysR family transcriptional regulator n=1 Tax=Streptomyces TaxID=1883 RepID=UPI000F735CEE|nr:LysR family transcriptional regulator [Streptomyces sp. WAC05292]RSS86524.1 LysR family transcriptional regulator [Streptomyces sp. WAC05292]
MNPRDVDPRLLRGFLAVAEELHFTRAAARLYTAQQALSRDVRRLEQGLGTALFTRTTRAVELTADGERLLPLARRVLAAHEELAAAFAGPRPLLVDVNTDGPSSARTVLDRARELAPDCELMARFESGLTHAAAEVAAGRLDVAFGYVHGLEPALRGRLDHMPVRYEPLAALLPHGHPLADPPGAPLPVGALAGEHVYAGAGNPRTLEWTRLARELFEGRGIALAPPAPVAIGKEEFRRVMAKTRTPVLVTVDFTDLPACTKRPLADPLPLSPLSMVWRRGFAHPGLDALRRAARGLAAERGWLEVPPGSWLPAAALTGPPGSG